MFERPIASLARIQGAPGSILWTTFAATLPTDRFFPEVSGSYERRLAEQRSPASAKRWHFAMIMTEESFRDLVRKHVHA